MSPLYMLAAGPVAGPPVQGGWAAVRAAGLAGGRRQRRKPGSPPIPRRTGPYPNATGRPERHARPPALLPGRP